METNFKVDVPSFALGYSAGKKKVPPAQEKEVTIKSNGKTEILPDEKQLLSKVTVNTNVELGFNIAYGTEPPEDTSKLWVKTEQPANNVIVSLDEVWEEGERPDSAQYVYNLAPNEATCCMAGSYIYAFGPRTGSSTIKRFNIDDRSVLNITGFSNTTSGPACGTVGTKIYIFGGASSTTGSTPREYAYVFETDQSATEKELLVKMEEKFHVYSNKGGCYSGCVVNGTDIHLLGGRYGNVSGNVSNVHQIFHTESQTYSPVKNMPASLCKMGCALADGYIYIFGGETTSAKVTNSIYRYDIENDSYMMLPVKLPYQTERISACKWGRRIYLFGGEYQDAPDEVKKTKTILYYDLDTGEIVECRAKIRNSSGAVVDGTGGAFPVEDKIWVAVDDYALNLYEPKIGEAVLENNALHIIPNNEENVFTIMKSGATRIEVNVGEVYKGDENNEAKPVEAALYKDGEWVDI